MVYFKGCVCSPYLLMLASAVHTAYPRELVTARLGLSPRCKYHLQHVFGPCRARADKRHITRSCSFGGARTAQHCIAIENLGIHTAAAVDWRCFLGWPRSSSPELSRTSGPGPKLHSHIDGMLAPSSDLFSLQSSTVPVIASAPPSRSLIADSPTRAYQTTKDRPNIALPLKQWGKGASRLDILEHLSRSSPWAIGSWQEHCACATCEPLGLISCSVSLLRRQRRRQPSHTPQDGRSKAMGSDHHGRSR
jgi:hypothetical protein